MRKTVNVDRALLKKARRLSHARSDTETISLGLEALIRSAAYQDARRYLGSEAGATSEENPRAPARRRAR